MVSFLASITDFCKLKRGKNSIALWNNGTSILNKSFSSTSLSSTSHLCEVLKFHHQNLKPKPYVSKKLTTMLGTNIVSWCMWTSEVLVGAWIVGYTGLWGILYQPPMNINAQLWLHYLTVNAAVKVEHVGKLIVHLCAMQSLLTRNTPQWKHTDWVDILL